jgi:hypothetical protein
MDWGSIWQVVGIQQSGHRPSVGPAAAALVSSAFVCSISSIRIIDVHSCPRAEQFDAALIPGSGKSVLAAARACVAGLVVQVFAGGPR